MQKKTVTLNQAVFCLLLFNFGSNVMIGINTGVEQDTWISILLATLMAAPVFLIYARLLQLFPQMNLFEMAEKLLGRIGGKIIVFLLTLYSIHVSALVTRNFSEFTKITTLAETPQLPIMMLMVITAVYLARSDMRAIAKWSVISVLFITAIVIFTFSAAISVADFTSLFPIFEHPPGEIANISLQVFSFPYGETVLLLCTGISFHKGENKPYKLFMISLALICPFLLVIFIRNLSLLGRQMMSISFFPSYAAVRIIEIGDFLARIEGSISSNFFLAGVAKAAICVLASAKGITKLFDMDDYRSIILPCGVFSLALSAILYRNTMEMFNFLDQYSRYAYLLQAVIPMLLWVFAEFHAHKQDKAKQQPAPAIPMPQSEPTA